MEHVRIGVYKQTLLTHDEYRINAAEFRPEDWTAGAPERDDIRRR